MKVILSKDLDELGLEGDVVDVAKGYARNYLIPKGFAVVANSPNMKAFEMLRKKIEVKRLKAKEQAEEFKEKLDDMVVTVTQKAGEEGKLYGSVTSMDIASELEKQGVTIDRKKIVLERPLKSLGEFEIPVKIYPGVTGTLKVVVAPEKQ